MKKNYRFLVVDDEKIERDGICFLLNRYGFPFEITARNNGLDALEYLREHPVDIICTDIKMPFMDGLRLCEEARRLQPKVLLVLLTAFGDFDYAKKAIRIQVDDYLLKPVVPVEFEGLMRQLCSKLDKQEEERKSRLRIIGQYRQASPQAKAMLLESLVSDWENRLEGSGEDTVEERRLVQDAMTIIGREYAADLTLAALAERLHISKGYLSGLFKQEMMLTVTQYITMLRMQRASQLLLETPLKIHEVAEAVGYHDDSYFGLSFKKAYGMSPAQFRNQGFRNQDLGERHGQ